MKTIKTLFVVFSIVFAFMLWWTRTEELQSQSAYAISGNSFWYYAMHISIVLSFISDWITHRNRWINWLPAIGSVLIMVFDMYNYPSAHNWATGYTMGSAVLSLLVYAPSPRERIYIALNCLVGALMFPLGIYTEVHLFFTEVIAEFCIGIGLARRFWIE